MTIVTFVKSIVESLVYTSSPIVRPTFGHGEMAFLNIQADNAIYPWVAMVTPTRGVPLPAWNQVEYSVLLLFTNKLTFDFQTDEHQAVVADMHNLARQFDLRLQKEDTLRFIKARSFEDMPMGTFDNPVAGVKLKLTITLMHNISNCLP